jgi:nucleotide-binding universal stress UspA family protein
VLVAVDGDLTSIEALRWAFDAAVTRGSQLEVIQAVSPDASLAEISGQQRDLAELLADWRSDFPGLAVRIDVTRDDPTQLLIDASAGAAVLVIGHPRTTGVASWSSSLAPRLMVISHCPLVVIAAAGRSNDRQREHLLTAV